MKSARQSDAVTWWRMGRNAVARYGLKKAMAMASDIAREAPRTLFLSGVNGEPRPHVRPAKEIT